MTATTSQVIFANDSEVARTAMRHFGWLSQHLNRRCRCRTEKACRRHMRDQVKVALRVLGQTP